MPNTQQEGYSFKRAETLLCQAAAMLTDKAR